MESAKLLSDNVRDTREEGIVDQRGLTLVEIGIVTAIVGIAAAIAIPTYVRLIPHIDLKNAAAQVADTMISSRMKSVSEGRDYQVTLDLAGDSVIVTPEGGGGVTARQLPQRVDLYADTSDAGVPPFSGNTVTFRPNGTADTINYEAAYLRNDPSTGERYRVRVLGITGKVSVQRWKGGGWESAY